MMGLVCNCSRGLGQRPKDAGAQGLLCGSILLLKQPKHLQMHIKSLSLSARSDIFRPQLAKRNGVGRFIRAGAGESFLGAGVDGLLGG